VGDRRVLGIVVGPETRSLVVSHVRTDVHQARAHERNAHDEVPEQLETRDLPALEMGEFVEEQRSAQHRKDCDHGRNHV